MSNPYDPQIPARPEYFGGRKEVLKKLKEKIELSVESKNSGGILIYGHRSVGKTSLIDKMVNEISQSEYFPNNILIVGRRLSKPTTENELYQMLIEEATHEIEKRKNWINKMKDKSQIISGLNIFGVGVNLNDVPKGYTPYYSWKRLVDNLNGVDLILISIDDADFLSKDAIGQLKTIVEDRLQIPVLLIISGFVGFEEKLVDDYSPVARVFSGANYNIGKFSFDEVKEVLLKPLEKRKVTWGEDAIKKVHKLTVGYPFLVQCLAKASYIEEGVITTEIVDSKLDEAINLAESWLNHEIPDASDLDIISFAKLADLNQDIIQSNKITSLGISALYVERLVKLGVLKRQRRGKYSIDKSPMIAIFEMLKRGLSKASQ